MCLEWTNSLKVWITSPLKHGNGGWYGDTVLGRFNLLDAIKINPYKKFNYPIYDGSEEEIFISSKNSSNAAFYKFIVEELRWEKVK